MDSISRQNVSLLLEICDFIFLFSDCISIVYTRFPNTHEPLIDEETFALAQKRIATRHRPTKSDEIDLFSGLLFCGDCSYKMYLQKVSAPMIKCKKTPRKKCRFMAEEAKKR